MEKEKYYQGLDSYSYLVLFLSSLVRYLLIKLLIHIFKLAHHQIFKLIWAFNFYIKNSSGSMGQLLSL